MCCARMRVYLLYNTCMLYVEQGGDLDVYINILFVIMFASFG